MQKFIIVVFLLLVLAGGSRATVTTQTDGQVQQPLKPDQVVKYLLDGNARYVKQKATGLQEWAKTFGDSLPKGSRPCAVILCCADLAIPPEVLFDKGAGCLFVLRVAGNVLNPAMIGSIEYAVEQLGVPVVMVLGHERCGVVAAAVAAKGEARGNYGSLLRTIGPAVRQATMRNAGGGAPELLELTIDQNALMVAENLADRSAVLKRLVDEGRVKIVAAKLAGDKGAVSVLEPIIAKD